MLLFDKLQGIVKSYTILKKTKQLQKKMDFLDELYSVNRANVNYENYLILQRFSRWNWLITKFVLIVFGGSFTLVIISPLPMYFVTGSFEPIMPIRIPFVDTKTTPGYVMHSTYMAILLTSAYFGTAAAELFLICLTIHIWPIVKIFENAINTLNETRAGPRQEAINNSTWLRNKVRNIALMHIRIYL